MENTTTYTETEKPEIQEENVKKKFFTKERLKKLGFAIAAVIFGAAGVVAGLALFGTSAEDSSENKELDSTDESVSEDDTDVLKETDSESVGEDTVIYHF